MCRGAAIALILLLPFGEAISGTASRQEQVLALIPFNWQQLKYDIVFLAPRPGVRAMTFSGEHRIEVYARPQDDVRLIAYDIAHEIGHAIDLTYNTDEMRKKWMELRGIDPATPWFGCDRCSDYATPSGDFAETFAAVVFGTKNFKGRIAPAPTSAQIPAMMSFFPVLTPAESTTN
jgi:hypothetical protein